MLQLEKIKNLIDENEKKIEYRANGHQLDFFKTSTFKLRKQSKKNKVFSALFWIVFTVYGYNVYSHYARIEKVGAESFKIASVYSEISDSINNKNIIDVDKFDYLTNNPTAYGSFLASTIIQKILLRDSDYQNNKNFAPELYVNYKPIDPKIKDEIFKIFLKNWEYGLKKEKELYSNCGIDFICHYSANRLESYHEKMHDMVNKQVIFVKHPDILEKELDLIKLKVKYQSYYK